MTLITISPSNIIVKSERFLFQMPYESGYVYKQDRIFFLKVEKGEKFAALLKLRDVFCPDVLYLQMERFEDKPEFLCKMVSEFFPVASVTLGIITTFRDIRSVEKSEKKPLVVVWDSCLHKQCCEQESCIIVLVEDEKEVQLMKAAKIREMNVSTYLYFNGASFEFFCVVEVVEFKDLLC